IIHMYKHYTHRNAIPYSLQPPRPIRRFTLFPYTTLFRSPPGCPIVVPGEKISARAAELLCQYRDMGFSIEGTEEENRIGVWINGDRKSTRLNSSHVSISYAVFCLKKKNKNY